MRRSKQYFRRFDDPLPGERDNLFLICRKIITGV
jgi:hypothetical protein